MLQKKVKDLTNENMKLQQQLKRRSFTAKQNAKVQTTVQEEHQLVKEPSFELPQ